jgi:dihydromonapterin reductase/dihydrofolate reductase
MANKKLRESMMPHIVVTGASRRLGLFLCESFLDDGWHVSALTRASSEDLTHLTQERLSVYELNYNSITQLTDACLSISMNPVDAIVHNASFFQKDALSIEATTVQLSTMMQTHVSLPKILNELLCDALKQSKNANIIQMSDIYVDNPNESFSNYCASKAAVENLSKSLAKQLAPQIRVNCIQPGALAFLPEHSESAKKAVLEGSLLKIEAGFEPILKTIRYIIENPFMTGASLKLDGGRSLCR